MRDVRVWSHYQATDIVTDSRFADMITMHSSGSYAFTLDYQKLNELIPCSPGESFTLAKDEGRLSMFRGASLPATMARQNSDGAAFSVVGPVFPPGPACPGQDQVSGANTQPDPARRPRLLENANAKEMTPIEEFSEDKGPGVRRPSESLTESSTGGPSASLRISGESGHTPGSPSNYSLLPITDFSALVMQKALLLAICSCILLRVRPIYSHLVW